MSETKFLFCILGAFLFVGVGAVSFHGWITSNQRCEYFKITKVGGCSQSGYCGILLEDGSVNEDIKPVEGASFRKCVWK